MTGAFVARRWPTLLLGTACLGLAAANWLVLPVPALLFVSALTAAGAMMVDGAKIRAVFVAAALAAAGLAWGTLRTDALDHSVLTSRVGETTSARVVVTGAARRTRVAARMPVVVRRFGAATLRERALLELRSGRAPPRGAVLEIVRARPVAPRGPETGFDERAWLARRGIHVVLRAERASVVGRRGGIGGVADGLRAHVERSLALGVSGERRALLDGFVLGDDGGLDSGLRNAFRASGLAHLTAVSGQNVTIVAGAVGVSAWLLGVGRYGVQLLAVGAILAYALAVGWEPSVVRAAVAGCVASLAWLASRPDDRWHALVLGALVLLAWQPASLLEPGFQLSFAAVAAILAVVPRVTRALAGYPLSVKAASGVAVAAACGAVTAPISWLHFGTIALWTVPANVAAEPAMPALLCLSLAAAAVAPVVPPAAAALAWLAGWCAWWIAACARLFASLPHAQLRSGAVLAVLAIAATLVAAVRLLPSYRRREATVALAVLAALAVSGWWALRAQPSWTPPAGLRVTFLDVGQGDGALVEVPQGSILVDEGPPEARVAAQLRRIGVRALSAVVLTHPQRDHVGGAPEVLRRLAVGTVLHAGLLSDSRDERAALAIARDRRVPVSVARMGDEYRLGRLRLRVLWPDGPGLPEEDPNQRAIVLLASYGAVDVLLTADAESDVTGGLPLRPVEVLKVAHHGSADPGLAEELRVLRPRIAVISVGRANDYGHPRPETLAALAASPGLRLLRTDANGRVIVESDGRTLTVRAEQE